LLCQFHDVLPGSGIGMIYEDAEERYANVRTIGAEVLKSAYAVLYPGSTPVEENSGEMIAINTLPGSRLEVMKANSGFVLVDAQDGLGQVKAMDGSLQGVKGEFAISRADTSRTNWRLVHYEQRQFKDGTERRAYRLNLRYSGRVSLPLT
jgi:alpha-mannosidase